MKCKCGNQLKNNTYGDRCEDCWAENVAAPSVKLQRKLANDMSGWFQDLSDTKPEKPIKKSLYSR